MFATILLITSTCTASDNCEFYQLDQWQEEGAVHECVSAKRLYPELETGCYVLSGEDDKSMFLESVENTGDEFLEVFK